MYPHTMINPLWFSCCFIFATSLLWFCAAVIGHKTRLPSVNVPAHISDDPYKREHDSRYHRVRTQGQSDTLKPHREQCGRLPWASSLVFFKWIFAHSLILIIPEFVRPWRNIALSSRQCDKTNEQTNKQANQKAPPPIPPPTNKQQCPEIFLAVYYWNSLDRNQG